MQHVLNHDHDHTSVQLIMNADKAIDETDGLWIYSGLISLQQTDYHGDDSILSFVFSLLRNKHNHLFLFTIQDANSFFFHFPASPAVTFLKARVQPHIIG